MLLADSSTTSSSRADAKTKWRDVALFIDAGHNGDDEEAVVPEWAKASRGGMFKFACIYALLKDPLLMILGVAFLLYPMAAFVWQALSSVL